MGPSARLRAAGLTVVLAALARLPGSASAQLLPPGEPLPPSGVVTCLSVWTVPWGIAGTAADGTPGPLEFSHNVTTGAVSQCQATVEPGPQHVGYGPGVQADAEASSSLTAAASAIARLAADPRWAIPPGYPDGFAVLVADQAGGARVEGGSSGLAYAVAIYSALTRRPVPASMAFTGGLAADGKLLPIGGLEYKLPGAAQMGVRAVVLPASMLEGWPLPSFEVMRTARQLGVQLLWVRTVEDALFHALGPSGPEADVYARYAQALRDGAAAEARGDFEAAARSARRMAQVRAQDATAGAQLARSTFGRALAAVDEGDYAAAVAAADALAKQAEGSPLASALGPPLAHYVGGVRAVAEGAIAAAAQEFDAMGGGDLAELGVTSWQQAVQRLAEAAGGGPAADLQALPDDMPGGSVLRLAARAGEDRRRAALGIPVMPIRVVIDRKARTDLGLTRDALYLVESACDSFEEQTGLRLSPTAVRLADLGGATPAQAVGTLEAPPDGLALAILPTADAAAWEHVLCAPPFANRLAVRLPADLPTARWYLLRAFALARGGFPTASGPCVLFGPPTGEPVTLIRPAVVDVLKATHSVAPGTPVADVPDGVRQAILRAWRLIGDAAAGSPLGPGV